MADYHHFPAVLLPENLDRLAGAYAHLRRAIAERRLAGEVQAAEARAATWAQTPQGSSGSSGPASVLRK